MFSKACTYANELSMQGLFNLSITEINDRLKYNPTTLLRIKILNCVITPQHQSGFSFLAETFPKATLISLSGSSCTANQLYTLVLAAPVIETLDLTSWRQSNESPVIDFKPGSLPSLKIIFLTKASIHLSFLKMLIEAAPNLRTLIINQITLIFDKEKNAGADLRHFLEYMGDAGSFVAQKTLAYLYEMGFNTISKNLHLARWWYDKANLKEECARIDKKLDSEFIETCVDIKENDRHHLFMNLMTRYDAGDHGAMKALAFCYRFGVVMPKDLGMAMLSAKFAQEDAWTEAFSLEFRASLEKKYQFLSSHAIYRHESETTLKNREAAPDLSKEYESGRWAPKHLGMAMMYAKLAGDMPRLNTLLENYLATLRFKTQTDFELFQFDLHQHIISLKNQAMSGDKPSMIQLKSYFQYGIVVKQNLRDAIYWSERAGNEEKTENLAKQLHTELVKTNMVLFSHQATNNTDHPLKTQSRNSQRDQSPKRQ